MSRFPVDVSAVLSEHEASVEVDSEVPLDELACGDTLLVFERRPRVRASIIRTDVGLVLSGTVTARARAECSRCLEPFELTLEGALEGGFYLPVASSTGDLDESWEVIQGESVDLMPSIEAAVRLEAPFAPVHDESCLGICPTCGCNLNVECCTCEREPAERTDGPFGALKDFEQSAAPDK